MKLNIQFGWAALLALTMVVGAPPAKAQVTEDGSHVQIGQAKDDLFAGTSEFAKGASSATEINMGPHSLDMVEGDHAAKARRTILSIVHEYTYDKPGMYSKEAVEVYRKKLQNGDWSCPVHTWDSKTGSSTDVCEKHRTDGLHESAIITVGPKSLTFIHTIKRAEDSGSSEMEAPPAPPAPSAPPAPPAPPASGMTQP